MSEDSWVFDSLVCFLHGPVWNAALQTFIEEKSLIFDPNEEVDVENPEFKRIYNEYKNLVDFMLGSFMTELSITPEQFEFACMEGKNLNILPSDESHASRHSFSFHQGLFQQIWAANDIRIFIRMMTQRNMELQLQALDLIERQASTHSKDEGEVPTHDTSEYPDINTESLEPTDKETEEITRSVELELHGDHLAELPSEGEQSDKFKRLNLFFDSERIKTADVEVRQEYLRSQRDKILKIKKQARARQLNETVKKTGRPNSAQMAQKFLDGEADVLEPSSSGAAQLRQTLAKRLRNEVVDAE